MVSEKMETRFVTVSFWDMQIGAKYIMLQQIQGKYMNFVCACNICVCVLVNLTGVQQE